MRRLIRRIALMWLSPSGLFFLSLTVLLWWKGPALADGFSSVEKQAVTLSSNWALAAPGMGEIDAVADQAKETISQVGTSAGSAISAAGTAVQRTSDTLNRRCKGEAGPDACGTMAQLNKTVIDAGNAIVTTQKEELKVFPHATAAMDSFKGMADGATGDLHPALTDFDALLKDQAVHRTVTNLADLSGNLNGIAGSFNKMSAHVEKKVDAPPTWKSRFEQWAEPTAKVGIWWLTK